MKGKVFLIGAGPGDPRLMTLKGRDCLRQADVVIYDALISPQLLDWAKPSAQKIYVGKRGHQHAKEQSEINDILLRHAQRGRQVARLKGGDPFLFGRGGEEALFLHDHGISYEAVPGVSSASGVSSYAGIPLTDRHLSSMVTMVTGHEGQGKQMSPVEWSRISRQSTLVIFMGLDQLPTITDRLLKLNWDAELPAAIVRWGSTLHQQILEGTLGDIADKAGKAELTSPVLIVIGKVVSLRKKLRWFDTKSLFGKKIAVTRPLDQIEDFARQLEDEGAEVLAFPTIQILPPRSWDPIDRAIKSISQFDWLLFTSVNGAKAWFERMRVLNMDIRDLKGVRLGAIGPKTRARLTELGLTVDAFPDEYRAEGLADALGLVKGARVLLATAEETRDVLAKTLEQRGAVVTIATAYRTVKTRGAVTELKKALLAQEIDVITFTSASTVDGFMQHFTSRERKRIFDHSKAAAIGPITASTLRHYGVRPAIQASRYTVDALARAIVKYFA